MPKIIAANNSGVSDEVQRLIHSIAEQTSEAQMIINSSSESENDARELVEHSVGKNAVAAEEASTDPRHARIYELATEGRSIAEIAKTLSHNASMPPAPSA